MQETWLRFLGQEDPLEKEMATHSSVLAWEIPWTEVPWSHKELGMTENAHTCHVVDTFQRVKSIYNIFR